MGWRLSRVRLAVVAAMLLPLPAMAGDIANLEPIGFSADGRVYAFQQSGIQDGSGFPYAEIFFLDIEQDRYLDPSPVRVRLDRDGTALADAMAEARARAAPLFERYRPDQHPGRAVLVNPITELSADSKIARFVPRAVLPPIDPPVELRLDTIPMAAPEACAMFNDIRGYRLRQLGLFPGQPARILHEDTAIPQSRGCPRDYHITRVEVFEKPEGGFSAVALIAVESQGFEGPDIRTIAIPIVIPVGTP